MVMVKQSSITEAWLWLWLILHNRTEPTLHAPNINAQCITISGLISSVFLMNFRYAYPFVL